MHVYMFITPVQIELLLLYRHAEPWGPFFFNSVYSSFAFLHNSVTCCLYLRTSLAHAAVTEQLPFEFDFVANLSSPPFIGSSSRKLILSHVKEMKMIRQD